MKRISASILLLIALTACNRVLPPSGGTCREGLCIQVTAAEPIRSMDESVTVTIMVTAEKDIPDLAISMLAYPREVVVEGPQGWEKDAKEGRVSQGGASWKMAAKANHRNVFTRRMRFLSKDWLLYDQGLLYSIIGEAYTPNLRVADEITIHATRAGGKVYLSGTPIPITPGPVPTASRSAPPTAVPTRTRAPYP